MDHESLQLSLWLPTFELHLGQIKATSMKSINYKEGENWVLTIKR